MLASAGLRKIRLHDLRHTFGSLLIQAGASLAYVKEQMGHSSIQVTVDIYGHLIPGANVSFVDKLDTATHQSAHNPHTPESADPQISPEAVDSIGGGGWTRTSDLRIMRCAFHGAANRIQSLPVGGFALTRGEVLAFGT